MKTNQDLPDNFSFVDKQLAVSGFPNTASQLKTLYNLGVTHIVSLTHNTPNNIAKAHEIPIKFIHLPTLGTPALPDIEKFLKFMTKQKGSNTKVLLHCQYGIERTGMFLAIYLSEKEGISIKEAISKTQKIRPHSLSNLESKIFLLSKFGKARN